METVGSLRRPKYIPSVEPTDTVATALQKMADYDLGAILIMKDDRIEGVFSERDYARKILLKGKSSLTTPISEVMTTQVIYVTPEYTLEECLALMTKKKMHHLPVIEGNKLLSFVNMEDVVAALIEDQVFYINELTKYVSGELIAEPESPYPTRVRELVYEFELII